MNGLNNNNGCDSCSEDMDQWYQDTSPSLCIVNSISNENDDNASNDDSVDCDGSECSNNQDCYSRNESSSDIVEEEGSIDSMGNDDMFESEQDKGPNPSYLQQPAILWILSTVLAFLVGNLFYQSLLLFEETHQDPPYNQQIDRHYSNSQRRNSQLEQQMVQKQQGFDKIEYLTNSKTLYDGATINKFEPSATPATANRPPPTRIYTHSSLSSKNYRAGGIISDDMLKTYERDGVLVLRNLISPKLLERLDEGSRILMESEQSQVSGKKNGRRRGKQFHMVKNGAIFMGVPPRVEELKCGGEIETCNINDENRTTGIAAFDDNELTMLSSFRDLAMYSKIPRVAASLLRLDEARVGGEENLKMGRSRGRGIKNSNADGVEIDFDSSENDGIDESINLRICRDIFLTKDDDPYACGWHVDDTGFWPSIASDPGINAWVALDDMPWPWSRPYIPITNTKTSSTPENTTSLNEADHQNEDFPVASFALSVGSHLATWRHEAYRVTGSTHTNPEEGYQSAADLVNRRSGSGTCNIRTSAPDLYEKLEQKKVIYDLKKGDVIFHDRWVFHRTVTVEEYNQQKQKRNMSGNTNQRNSPDGEKETGSESKIFRRYSIRYSPGTARVPPGYGVELSVLHNQNNANSTLDEIVERDGPWYPKVWPRVLKKMPHRISDLQHFSTNDTKSCQSNGCDEEIEGLTELVYEKIPQAEETRKERKKEIQHLVATRGGL